MKRFIARWFERRSGPVAEQAPSREGSSLRAPSWPDPVADELCPLPQPMPLDEATRVLAFAPHPDDESIGCGGLLSLLIDRGVPVRVVLVTDGAGAGGLPPGADLIRQAEFRAALGQLGVNDGVQLGFPDGGLEPSHELAVAVQRQLQAFAPDWVLMPALNDLHRDHRVLAAVVRQQAATLPSLRALWQYETWSALAVTHVVDVAGVLHRKRAAIAAHRTALACGNYLEGALGLAAYRGLLLGASRPGSAAEGFVRTPVGVA